MLQIFARKIGARLMQKCHDCDSALTPDEIAMSKKLINRSGETLLCYECLAKKYAVSIQTLKEKADFYRDSGCTLFAPKTE